MVTPFVPLLQEFEMTLPGSFSQRAWRATVVCVLLNQTTGRQVRKILDDLFQLAPCPFRMMTAANSEPKRLEKMLKPLGLQNRRRLILRDFSRGWIYLGGQEDATAGSALDHAITDFGLAGVGNYARDSWDLVVQRRMPTSAEVTDKELKRMLEECCEQSGYECETDEDVAKALSWRAENLIGVRK